MTEEQIREDEVSAVLADGCAKYGHCYGTGGRCSYCGEGWRETLSNLAIQNGDRCQPYGKAGAVQVLYRGQRPDWRYYRLAGWVVTAHCGGPSIVLCRRVSPPTEGEKL